jgi:carboxyl-terminal processing protease
MKLVHENYVDKEQSSYDRLTREALHGLVEAMDPHSEFLEEKEFSSLDEEMRGDFGGVGIQVEGREGRFVVIAPIAGTPAEKEGILRGDELQAIDGTPLGAGMGMEDVVARLRGEPGTKVSIKLLRPGASKVYEVQVRRERIRVDSVGEARLLPDGTGYVQLIEFTERTADEFDEALDRLLEQGMHSLVLDLRNNPGGLLDVAVYVAEPFFAKGELIVYTQGRHPGDREEFRSESRGEPLSLPVAVLINAGSASAAEIVAGAFKDSGKAIIVGERSFGKGSVQTIFKLRDGEGMRLTTARYFTPKGISIHGRGIEPHIEVVMSPEEDAKVQEWRSRRDLQEPGEYEARYGTPPPVDRQLDAALDALKGLRLLESRGFVRKPMKDEGEAGGTGAKGPQGTPP